MPQIRPVPAIGYATTAGTDLSAFIAPPYDVIDEADKQRLLAVEPHNIVAIDLPHWPTKTVGPNEAYEQAGRDFRQWIRDGILVRRSRPSVFVYQQTYTAPDGGRPLQRRGLIANVRLQPLGRQPDGCGAIFPHEQTFSGPKQDRLKLMQATGAQLSPIFGLYSDPDDRVGPLLREAIQDRAASFRGRTGADGVFHEVWAVEDRDDVDRLTGTLSDFDLFIADGHHRYTTALNYQESLLASGQRSPQAGDHPANDCLFVLVAMQDPGMIVLPTHRVLGGMSSFSLDRLTQLAQGKLRITPFRGSDLAALEKALPEAGPHAMGFYDPTRPDQPLAVATTVDCDPLADAHPDQSTSWRQLDVAILQHLVVEGICRPNFCPTEGQVTWRFPHSLKELKTDAHSDGYQLGVIMQPTPLESVRQVSEAGELMPQKSTFFYPKIATGLVINPLDV